ncbi:MAG: hypothetical protein AB7S50_06640 [Bacteroidales bacterium]
MKIEYIQHNQINRQKWDSSITNAQNRLVYALSWYLDIVSPNWDALIHGDYEMVMPLTYKKKFGIKILYQPIFAQQLGVFSRNQITTDELENFIDSISMYFKFIEINLNSSNKRLNSTNLRLKNTQIVDLSLAYHNIFSNYSNNHKKNLKIFNKSGFIINNSGSSSDYIFLLQKMYEAKKIFEIKKKDLEGFKKIIDYSLSKGFSQLFFGYLNNELCAAAFFLKWGNRVIFFSAMNEIGRNASAMFGIIDNYIKENAGQDLILDFAGSNIPGVKYRNLGFGAKNETYFAYKYNNLPIPYKWFKR